MKTLGRFGAVIGLIMIAVGLYFSYYTNGSFLLTLLWVAGMVLLVWSLAKALYFDRSVDDPLTREDAYDDPYGPTRTGRGPDDDVYGDPSGSRRTFNETDTMARPASRFVGENPAAGYPERGTFNETDTVARAGERFVPEESTRFGIADYEDRYGPEVDRVAEKGPRVRYGIADYEDRYGQRDNTDEGYCGMELCYGAAAVRNANPNEKVDFTDFLPDPEADPGFVLLRMDYPDALEWINELSKEDFEGIDEYILLLYQKACKCPELSESEKASLQKTLEEQYFNTVQPQTEEQKKLHQDFLQSMQSYEDGYTRVIEAVLAGDYARAELERQNYYKQLYTEIYGDDRNDTTEYRKDKSA